jgi:hypothetical protein
MFRPMEPMEKAVIGARKGMDLSRARYFISPRFFKNYDESDIEGARREHESELGGE